MIRSQFRVVKKNELEVVIEDIGHDNGFMSVTNDIENVVSFLYNARMLREGQRLLYYDSLGELTEALHENGEFVRYTWENII